MELVFTEKDKIWADFRDENWNSPYLIQYELYPEGIDKKLLHLFLFVSALQNKPLWFQRVASRLDIEGIPEMEDFQTEPLHTCIRLNDNYLFLYYMPKFDMNAFDKNGVTPIQLATQLGRVNMVEYLHSKGASLISVDSQKRSLLNFATISNNNYLIKKFMDYYNEENNPILESVAHGNREAVLLIGKRYPETQKGAFQVAIKMRNVKMVKILLTLFKPTASDYEEELIVFRGKQDLDIHDEMITLLKP